MTRHEEREAALILLFQMELNGSDLDETLALTEEAFELETNSAVLKIASGVSEHKDEIDEIISRYSKTRAVSRISKVNITIMRIAVYEMLFNSEVPDKVAINEAIELSKEYAEKQDSNFISGLLGSYYRDKNDEHS